MLQTKFLTISLLLMFFQQTVFAKTAEPITIQSDKAEFNYHNKTAYHQGHVILTQGNRTIYANELTIENNDKNEIKAIIAKGSPAKYKFSNKEEMLKGDANTIEFYPNEHKLSLLGNALLNHGGDTINGPIIHYDIDKQTMISLPKDNQRTTIVLQPQNSSLQ